MSETVAEKRVRCNAFANAQNQLREEKGQTFETVGKNEVTCERPLFQANFSRADAADIGVRCVKSAGVGNVSICIDEKSPIRNSEYPNPLATIPDARICVNQRRFIPLDEISL